MGSDAPPPPRRPPKKCRKYQVAHSFSFDGTPPPPRSGRLRPSWPPRPPADPSARKPLCGAVDVCAWCHMGATANDCGGISTTTPVGRKVGVLRWLAVAVFLVVAMGLPNITRNATHAGRHSDRTLAHCCTLREAPRRGRGVVSVCMTPLNVGCCPTHESHIGVWPLLLQVFG